MPDLDLQGKLNELAGTTGLEAQSAVNLLNGTTQVDLVKALNTYAGTAELEFNGAVKAVATLIGGDVSLDSGNALDNVAASWINRSIAYWKANQYSGSGDLLDLTGRGHHARLGAISGADGADPLYLAYTNTKYVYFPGTAGNSITVPNPSAASDYTITYEDNTSQIRLASIANPLTFGGTDVDFSGKKVKQIEVRNNVGGAVTATFIANNTTEPYATHVGPQGQTWTFNRIASGRKLAVVDRPLFLFGADDYMEVTNHANLNFGATDSFTVAIACRMYGSSGSYALIVKRTVITGVAGFPGWSMRADPAGPTVIFVIDDGTTTASDTDAPGFTAGVAKVLSGVRDTFTDTVGAGGATAADITTGSLTNTEALRIGRRSASGSNFADMEFIGAALIRRALTAAELTSLGTSLLS